jgi:ubiquinone/menaquinone biosynthesis C-methylase UbiE
MKTAKQFYKELGFKELSARKLPEYTIPELEYLENKLTRKDKILDLACGYGRLTIPLAKKGYKIEGIDISPNLIKAAKLNAKREKLKINFKIGDMRSLPYDDKSFNVIICMWSAFIEIATPKDQIKALREMLRVLDNKGFAFIETPNIPKETLKKHFETITVNGNLAYHIVNGIEANPHYVHNRKTLTELIKTLRPAKYKIYIDIFGGRKRLFLQFWK